MQVYFFTKIDNIDNYSIAFIDKYLRKHKFNKKISLYIPENINSKEFIDKIWHYQPAKSFISAEYANNINAKHANVLIYNKLDFFDHNSTTLINFSHEVINTNYFEVLVELVDNDEKNIINSRNKYKIYANCGYSINHKISM